MTGAITVTATNTSGANLASGALLTFTIATTQDAVVEGTETFTVSLASATATVVTPTITTSITDNDAPFALFLPALDTLQGNGLNKDKVMGTFASGFTYSLGAGSSSGFVLTDNGVLSTNPNNNVASNNIYTLNVIATDQFGSHTIVVKIWVGTTSGTDTINLATLGRRHKPRIWPERYRFHHRQQRIRFHNRRTAARCDYSWVRY